MYELIQVAPRTYYIDCPAKIGLYRINDSEICLIDSGSDADAAKKILKHLTANAWTLRAVYITHSHADHTGGCATLANRTGCSIYAPEGDLSFTRHPQHEPSLLYGGCPPKPLRNKFLMAKPSSAKPLTPEALPEGLEMIFLDGHCPAMAAFRTSDGVWFLGDCMSSAEIIEKYHVNYLSDPRKYLDALETVKGLEGACFIPAHAPILEDVVSLADKNIAKVHEIAALILSLCETPAGFDAILKGVFDHFDLNMNWGQYVLVGSTIRGYLAWLLDEGQLTTSFDSNRMLWKSALQSSQAEPEKNSAL